MSPPPAPHQNMQKLRPDKAGILARPVTPNAPAPSDTRWAEPDPDHSILMSMPTCDAEMWDDSRHYHEDAFSVLCPTQSIPRRRRKPSWKRAYQTEYNRHSRRSSHERTLSRMVQEIWAVQSKMTKEAHSEWSDPWADTCSDRHLKADEWTCDAETGSTSRSSTVAFDFSFDFKAPIFGGSKYLLSDVIALLIPRPVSTRVDLTDRYGWQYSKSRERHPALHSVKSFTNHLGLLVQERLGAGRAADTSGHTTELFTGTPTIRDIIRALTDLGYESLDLAPGLRAGTDFIAVRSYRATRLDALWPPRCDLPLDEPERLITKFRRIVDRRERLPLDSFHRRRQGQDRAHLPTPFFMCSTVQPAAP